MMTKKTKKTNPPPTRPTPLVKRAMTRSTAMMKLAEEAAKWMGLPPTMKLAEATAKWMGLPPAPDLMEVRWFDDGSGVEGIYHSCGDGTFLWIDHSGCLALQQELFGGPLEMTQTSSWVQANYDSAWNAFRLRNALPVTATCFADLSDALQEEHGDEWTEICDAGMIVVVVPPKIPQ